MTKVLKRLGWFSLALFFFAALLWMALMNGQSVPLDLGFHLFPTAPLGLTLFITFLLGLLIGWVWGRIWGWLAHRAARPQSVIETPTALRSTIELPPSGPGL